MKKKRQEIRDKRPKTGISWDTMQFWFHVVMGGVSIFLSVRFAMDLMLTEMWLSYAFIWISFFGAKLSKA